MWSKSKLTERYSLIVSVRWVLHDGHQFNTFFGLKVPKRCSVCSLTLPL